MQSPIFLFFLLSSHSRNVYTHTIKNFVTVCWKTQTRLNCGDHFATYPHTKSLCCILKLISCFMSTVSQLKRKNVYMTNSREIYWNIYYVQEVGLYFMEDRKWTMISSTCKGLAVWCQAGQHPGTLQDVAGTDYPAASAHGSGALQQALGLTRSSPQCL